MYRTIRPLPERLKLRQSAPPLRFRMNALAALGARVHSFALGYTSPRGAWLLAWASWSVMTLVLITVAAGAWWSAGVSKVRRQAVDAQTLALQRTAVRSPVVEPVADFSVTLGPALPAARFIGELERACARAGVALVSQSALNHNATATELGRQEFRVALRAGYGPIKQVLGHMLARFEQASVSSMRWRQDATGNLLDAALVFSVWSPAAPAGSGPISPVVR